MFARDTVSDTFVVVLEREPDWSLVPATTPLSLVRLMRWCLQKDPSRRLRDIADARPDIDDLDAGAVESEAVARPSRLARALPWVIAAGAIGLMLMMATQTSRHVAAPSPLRLSVVPPEGTTWAPFDISGAPQFALSPDGKQMALVVADTTRVPRLWVRPLDSANGRPLSGTDQASGPFWSPDGAAIAFFADRKLKRILIESGSVQELAEAARDKDPVVRAAATSVLRVVRPDLLQIIQQLEKTEKEVEELYPPALTHPEWYYGFVSVTLAWQIVYLMMWRDPLRFRPMLLPAIGGKVGFATSVLVLFAQQRLDATSACLVSIDLLLAALFFWAFLALGGPTKPGAG